MQRVVFADQNASVRIIQQKFVEVIQSNIAGGFGKCLKLNHNRDLVYTVREDFSVPVIDLTHSSCKVKETHHLKDLKIELLADWSVDHKNGYFFFMMNMGIIVVYDSRRKVQTQVKVEEKWYISLSKEDRNFTAMTLSFNFKYLALSGVVKFKEKKTNNIFLYQIDINDKRDVKLSLVSQIATENTWEGSKQTK